jgi:hypothetical protein
MFINNNKTSIFRFSGLENRDGQFLGIVDETDRPRTSKNTESIGAVPDNFDSLIDRKLKPDNSTKELILAAKTKDGLRKKFIALGFKKTVEIFASMSREEINQVRLNLGEYFPIDFL